MKRLVVALVLLVACGVAASWLGWSDLSNFARARIERALTDAFGIPCHIEDFVVSVVPLTVHAGGIEIGRAPSLAQIQEIDVRVWLLASLAAARPVLTLGVNAPKVDLTHLIPSPAGAPTPKNEDIELPPVDMRDIQMTQGELQFRLGNTPVRVTVAHLATQLHTGLLRRTLTGALKATGIEMQRKGYILRVNELHADGGADGEGVFVNTAELTGEGIMASARATGQAHHEAVAATFDPALLGVFVDELSFIGGQAQLEGTLSGNLVNPILDGHLLMTQASIGQHTLGDLDTHVAREGTNLRFHDVRLTAAAGQVAGNVEMTIDKEIPIHGDLTWQAVDLAGLLAVIGTTVPFANTFNATTTVSGSLDPLDLGVGGTGTLDAAEARVPKEVAGWEISGRIHAHDLQARLDVNQPERNRVTTTVTLEGAQMEKLGGTVTVDAADLALLSRILPTPVQNLALTGAGQGTATLSGSTDHPVVAGTVAAQNLTVVGVPASRLHGDYAIARGRLTTASTELETTAGAAELNGTLALNASADNDWRLSVHDLHTDHAVAVLRGFAGVEAPFSGGVLNGTFQCGGNWRRATTRAELVATSLRVLGEPLDRVEVKATTALPQWELQLVAAREAQERLTVDAKGEGTAHLQLALQSTPLTLSGLHGPRRGLLDGTVVVQGRFSGEPLRLDGSAQLTATGLRFNGRTVGDAAFAAEARQGEWTLKGNALADTVDVSATLHSLPVLAYAVDVTWHELNLAHLMTDDQSLRAVSSGEMNLSGSLRALRAPTGALQVTRLEVSRDRGRVEAPDPIRIDVDNGRWTIRSLTLAAQGSRLSLTGGWTFAGPVDLDVEGDADLVLLELIGPPIHAARGRLSVGAHVVRTVETGWALQGQATVRDAALDASLPVAFTDATGDFRLSGSGVEIDGLRGRAGGGDFTVGGAIDFNRGPRLSWTVREVVLNVPEWLEERVSGKGEAQGTWRQFTVSGDIDVLNALYDRRIEIADLLPWFKEHVARAPRTEPPVAEVRLDLRIHAPDGLFVDNNFAKAEMGADLRVTGTTEQPILAGTVEILGGEVPFRNRIFTITGGAIEFQDPYRINPVLNISAESRMTTTDADYTVFVVVSGTAENPRVQFSADDPGLSQNDVLSLVATGKTTAQAQREGGGVAVGDVLALLPTQVTGDVHSRMRQLFGVDRFEVEPVFVRDTGSIEPRITIGKDITDRLRALASTSLGAETQQAVQLEYRVTGRVSLLGTWEGRTQQQAGAFGGDVKFRYEFRKVPFSLFSDYSNVFSQGDVP